MSTRPVSASTRTLDLPAPALLAAVSEVVHAGGGAWLVVSGWSMTPLIRPGDRVLLERRASVRPGDIIFADCDGRPVLHRVVRVTDNAVFMRGDNGPRDPQEIDRASIVGSAVLLERGTLLVALGLSARFGLRPLVHFVLARLWLSGWAVMTSIHRRRLLPNG